MVMVTHDTDVERYADRVVRIRDGRTSMETRRDGLGAEEELVVVDRAGRLQLPPALAKRMAGGRVRVREVDGRIVIERVDG
jgi:energy-coupling factor transporter ATP-binding protein EcfA2